jgi:hypothetical protein
MHEYEIGGAVDAAFFLANEVVNEYHSFPVVNRADMSRAGMFILLNEKWFLFEAKEVKDVNTITELENMVS